jgi:ATP-dependent DNA helicase RecG
MIENRENEHTEFKKSTSELKESIISLVSMLNKGGYGTVYFGIKNNGEIVGQQIGEQTTQDISREIKTRIKPRITPKIEILDIDNKKIISVAVQGEDLPYSAYDRYYIRSDDEDNILTCEQLERFFTNRNYDYSDWEKQTTEYTVDDIDEQLLIEYVNKGNDCGRINFLYKDGETTLRKLNLLDGKYLNNAGYYLFSNKKPLLLKLATYPTDERIYFSDLKQFRGNIFECINEAVKYVTNNIRWKAEIVGFERVEIPEIPLEAFREIIINSFVHMKVNDSSSNEIYITPSKVHIYNPGPLVPGTDPKMFASGEQGSMIRNPLIATALYYNRTIDAFGTGFERVFKLCKDIKYQYSNNQFGFTFEFLRDHLDIINDSISSYSEFSESEKKLYKYLLKGNRYTKQELANAIGKSSITVQRYLKHMMELGLIKREGANKNGRWVVVK